MPNCSDRPWNNFVVNSSPASYEPGSSKRAAAIASLFMGGADNGGLNSFLTSTHYLDASEVLGALIDLGASATAHQLKVVLQGLGVRCLYRLRTSGGTFWKNNGMMAWTSATF